MLSFRSLASGSSGNVYLLQADGVSILIDCGMSARKITGHLRHYGVEPSSLGAILLTHEHIDHVQSLGTLARRYKLPVIATAPTLAAAQKAVGDFLPEPIEVGKDILHGEVAIRSFSISHDAAAPVGFLITYRGQRICLATDLGIVSGQVAEALSDADLMVVEANHDRERLINGPYPMPLKARILGDRGHLSNLQTAQLLTQVAGSRPRSVWLAHLSEVNNTPKLALKVVSNYLDMAGITNLQVQVALRDEPSLCWHAGSEVRQLRLI